MPPVLKNRISPLLSEEFLQDVKDMKHKESGVGTAEENPQRRIKVRLTYNVVEGKKLLEMLEHPLKNTRITAHHRGNYRRIA